MKYVIFNLAMLFGIFTATQAMACMCALSDDSELQEKTYKKFDIVAVVEVLDSIFNEDPNKPKQYKLRPVKTIKGNPKETFMAYDFMDTTCGNYLKVGNTYALGFDRQTGNKFMIYSECDQLLLDSYLAGDVNLNLDPGLVPANDGMMLGEDIDENYKDMPHLNSGTKLEYNFQN